MTAAHTTTPGGFIDGAAGVRAAESRGESVDQLLDRNLAELRQELRVTLTGVQLQFGIPLGLVCTQRFEEPDGSTSPSTRPHG